jgi:hypothetical protein
LPQSPIGTTRIGILIFGIGGAALGMGMDLGLIFDRRVAEPLLQGLILALRYWARIPLFYRADQYQFYILLIAAAASFWLLLCVAAFIGQPARDRALNSYLASRERLDDARRATLQAELDPPA